VFDEYCTAAVEQVRRDFDGPDDEAFARLAGHVRSFAAATASDVAHRGCLLAKGTAELAEHDPEVVARSLRTFDELERILAADIEACQRHGDISGTADPRALAVLLLAVLRGIEALGKGRQGRSVPEHDRGYRARPAAEAANRWSTVGFATQTLGRRVLHGFTGAAATPARRRRTPPWPD
jgi:hypothetical protein